MWWVLFVAGAVAADGWALRGGVHVAPASHGVVDITWSRGPWTLGLYSDTLEVRFGPSGGHGRAWVAARGEYGAAGLMISPWADGALDPARARRASYVGWEAGGLRYGPGGLYAGAQASARYWALRPMQQTTIALPPDHAVLGGDALIGLYRPWIDGWARVGVDAEPGGGAPSVIQPHAQVQIAIDPRWALSPRVELRAGVADGQSDITRTRLGGVNPYVVPLAGAGWGEWWVEDYVAVRGAGVLRAGAVELSAFSDAAAFDGEEAVGLGGSVSVRKGRAYGGIAGGGSAWIERDPGVPALSAFVQAGWGP